VGVNREIGDTCLVCRGLYLLLDFCIFGGLGIVGACADEEPNK
jgi:hypothetical protein